MIIWEQCANGGVYHQFVSAAGTETIDFFVNYDADMLISANGVAIDTRSF